MSDTDAHAAAVQRFAPVGQQRGILLEFEVALLAVDVGTDQDIVVAQFLFDGQRLRGDHGVDASHLVADLPAYLEQVVGSQMEFVRV